MSCTRRRFLEASLGFSTLLSFGSSVPAVFGRSTLAAALGRDTGDKVLVIVQLSGGNDGLNTLIPFDDDEYARQRPTLRIAPDRVHKIDSHLGFHPKMAAFRRLYEDGHLSVVQGVGYPQSSRDHDGALRDWHTAMPGASDSQTGWAGRAIDRVDRGEEAGVPGVFVGGIASPFGVNTERAIVPSIHSLEDWSLQSAAKEGSASHLRRRLVRLAATPRGVADDSLLEFLRRSTLEAYKESERVESLAAAARSPGTANDYPPFQLARTFSTIAQLLRADLGIRIYFTEIGGGGIGGFDSHANQAANHGALLGELSESVAAFVRDLERDGLLDRVLLMTFSEFGRTVAENGRRGTGHGAAAPIFLAGGRLRGGLVGAHPSLTDLDNGAMKFHTDLRRVYATVLDRWLGIGSQAILGETYEPLDVLKA